MSPSELPAGSTKVDEIYATLRRRISLLQVQPGARLREEPLATEFGVSRTPIRQVLARLQHERLVQHEAGTGATVAIMDRKEIRDVWAVRLKMGELVADFVRLPAAPAVVAELEAIQHDLEDVRTSRDLAVLGATYTHFHTTVLEVYTSRTLRRIQDQLFHLTTREWLQFLPELDLDHEIDVIAEEVADTLAAVQASSGQALAAIRTAHMQRLLARFNAHVSRPLG